jgi:hypothetical protein
LRVSVLLSSLHSVGNFLTSGSKNMLTIAVTTHNSWNQLIRGLYVTQSKVGIRTDVSLESRPLDSPTLDSPSLDSFMCKSEITSQLLSQLQIFLIVVGETQRPCA